MAVGSPPAPLVAGGVYLHPPLPAGHGLEGRPPPNRPTDLALGRGDAGLELAERAEVLQLEVGVHLQGEGELAAVPAQAEHGEQHGGPTAASARPTAATRRRPPSAARCRKRAARCRKSRPAPQRPLLARTALHSSECPPPPPLPPQGRRLPAPLAAPQHHASSPRGTSPQCRPVHWKKIGGVLLDIAGLQQTHFVSDPTPVASLPVKPPFPRMVAVVFSRPSAPLLDAAHAGIVSRPRGEFYKAEMPEFAGRGGDWSRVGLRTQQIYPNNLVCLSFRPT